MLEKLRGLRKSAPSEGDDDPFVEALRAALGPDRVKYDGAHRALLSHDASVFDGGNSGPVCYPTTTAEVQAVVQLASRYPNLKIIDAERHFTPMFQTVPRLMVVTGGRAV